MTIGMVEGEIECASFTPPDRNDGDKVHAGCPQTCPSTVRILKKNVNKRKKNNLDVSVSVRHQECLIKFWSSFWVLVV